MNGKLRVLLEYSFNRLIKEAGLDRDSDFQERLEYNKSIYIYQDVVTPWLTRLCEIVKDDKPIMQALGYFVLNPNDGEYNRITLNKALKIINELQNEYSPIHELNLTLF